jgi:hypothetical protein
LFFYLLVYLLAKAVNEVDAGEERKVTARNCEGLGGEEEEEEWIRRRTPEGGGGAHWSIYKLLNN